MDRFKSGPWYSPGELKTASAVNNGITLAMDLMGSICHRSVSPISLGQNVERGIHHAIGQPRNRFPEAA